MSRSIFINSRCSILEPFQASCWFLNKFVNYLFTTSSPFVFSYSLSSSLRACKSILTILSRHWLSTCFGQRISGRFLLFCLFYFNNFSNPDHIQTRRGTKVLRLNTALQFCCSINGFHIIYVSSFCCCKFRILVWLASFLICYVGLLLLNP